MKMKKLILKQREKKESENENLKLNESKKTFQQKKKRSFDDKTLKYQI